jgi:uncharacterized lipoprotein YddW (UPF0748 family)
MKKLFWMIPFFFWMALILNSRQTIAKPPVRGVWLTHLAGDVLGSRENIREAVSLCRASGINTIFVGVWNNGYTLYPSDVTLQYFGETIDPRYRGRDPLHELVEEASAAGIAVHAWFEYGFAASHQQEDGGKIIRKFPHWAAKDIEGNLLTKDNFQWLNTFHPEVQAFLLQLILEVVDKYDIAGIQGDDRLSALPSTGGYDDYTVHLYKREHKGKIPPDDHLEETWTQWRAEKLHAFLRTLFHKVKSKNKNLLVSMSPHVFPRSREEYLRDWPTWVEKGWVDYIIPQIYQYQGKDYETVFLENLDRVNAKDRKKFLPGVLIKADDYLIPDALLEENVRFHRECDIEGEVFFVYEGLLLKQAFFKSYN